MENKLFKKQLKREMRIQGVVDDRNRLEDMRKDEIKEKRASRRREIEEKRFVVSFFTHHVCGLREVFVLFDLERKVFEAK